MSRRLSRRLSRHPSSPCACQRRPESTATPRASTLGYLSLATVALAATLILAPAGQAAEPDPVANQAVTNQAVTHQAVTHQEVTNHAVADQADAGPPTFNPRQYLLNALLAPALDPDSDPPTWLDPRPVLACAEGSTVSVDGRPLVVGDAVPPGHFVMEWQAVHCRPFGLEGPRFDGTARLLVHPLSESWAALVVPDGLVITLADGRTEQVAITMARMPLGAVSAPRELASRASQAPLP